MKGVFSAFMVHAWEAGTMVAVVAGVVGFFVVLRGAAFPAHAIPNGAFAGAAAASLVGFDSLLGLGACAVLAALGIGGLGRRDRQDVLTALALVSMLAVGSLLLSRTDAYEPQVYSLLFGEVLGVSSSELVPVAGLAVACLAATAVLYRRLMLASALPEVAEAKGLSVRRIDTAFLVVLALATAMTVPVVGALLIFSLMIGPPAAAHAMSRQPLTALGLSVLLALATVWAAIALSYLSNWPVGFFVGSAGVLLYGLGRVVNPAGGSSLRRRRPPDR